MLLLVTSEACCMHLCLPTQVSSYLPKTTLPDGSKYPLLLCSPVLLLLLLLLPAAAVLIDGRILLLLITLKIGK